MKKEIIITTDGSHSIIIPEMGVSYHSVHGAIQESLHVFIEAGLQYIIKDGKLPAEISILELGFGTGLNTLLTLASAEKSRQNIYYETIEPNPLEPELFSALNYCSLLQRPELQPLFNRLHECAWDTETALTPWFNFKKRKTGFAGFSTNRVFNLVYFDAFAPDIQPELWTVTAFKKLYDSMLPGAVLTTYCSKSVVRRAMAEAGFVVEKIPGPPHKREIVRAVKR